jgi:hypothetical protein
MTKLTDARKTVMVKLPTYPDAEVEMYTTLLTGDAEKLKKMDDDFVAGLETVRLLIKRWSFTDEAGKDLPVSLDNIRLLPTDDFMVMMSVVTEQKEKEERKKK